MVLFRFTKAVKKDCFDLNVHVVCFICEKPSIYFVKASTSNIFPDIHYMLD